MTLAAPSAAASFTPRELGAIHVGLADLPDTIGPSPWARLLRRALGRPLRTLADPRLEAMRRLVVSLHYGTAQTIISEARSAVRSGVTRRQVNDLILTTKLLLEGGAHPFSSSTAANAWRSHACSKQHRGVR